MFQKMCYSFKESFLSFIYCHLYYLFSQFFSCHFLAINFFIHCVHMLYLYFLFLIGHLGIDSPWLDLCTSLHLFWCGYHARIYEEKIWRTKDSNLPICTIPHFVYIHQNIGMYPRQKSQPWDIWFTQYSRMFAWISHPTILNYNNCSNRACPRCHYFQIP